MDMKRKIIKKLCLYCGKNFIKKLNIGKTVWSKQKYCSRNCYFKSRIGKTHKSGYKLPERTEEHRKNLSISNRGENNGNWKGGKFKLVCFIRQSFKYRQWRSDVFTRDNYTCQECNKKGGNIEAHHIKSISNIIDEYNLKTLDESVNCEELWNINNGQTLCKECHKKTDNWGNKS